MSLYLDTSALVKLFVVEIESQTVLETTRSQAPVYMGWLSELECRSALHKKLRSEQIRPDQLQECLASLSDYVRKAAFIPFQPSIIGKAKELLDRFGPQGLRTLDSLQIATALESGMQTFGTSDRGQSEIAKQAGLQIKLF